MSIIGEVSSNSRNTTSFGIAFLVAFISSGVELASSGSSKSGGIASLIDADNEGSIYECRKRGFEQLENTTDFLNCRLQEGSYGEMWSVRKVLRRFIWHDRIHAKAMWKMVKKTFGENAVENIFGF